MSEYHAPLYALHITCAIVAITLSLSLSLPDEDEGSHYDAVDVDAVRAHNGRTALHLASFHGHLDCVKYLVEDGNADPNVLCLAKETALFSAIRGGSADVVGYLLERCKLRLANEATGENGIIIAEQLNIDDPSKASHAKVVETILTSISDSELSEIEHLHECYKSRKSLKAYEDQLAAEAAKAAALAEEQRKAEELEVARSMVEAIFEIADTDGFGHLNAAALNALHERIGAGIRIDSICTNKSWRRTAFTIFIEAFIIVDQNFIAILFP